MVIQAGQVKAVVKVGILEGALLLPLTKSAVFTYSTILYRKLLTVEFFVSPQATIQTSSVH